MRDPQCLLSIETRIGVKIGIRIVEGAVLQLQETLFVPFFKMIRFSINIDAEIEEITHRKGTANPRWLQHIQPLNDQNIRTLYHDFSIRNNVITDMGIARCSGFSNTALN